MNKAILMGRLTGEPEVRRTGEMTIAKWTTAVDRKGKKDEADFIRCTAFGKSAEFVEKYVHKGTKVVVAGRIQTGSYDDKDGKKVYTTDVIAEEIEFAESKKADGAAPAANIAPSMDFVNVPEGVNEDLPFGLPQR